MSTLPDREVTALVVIDLQQGVVAEAYARDEVLGAVARVLDRARAAGTPVVWVQHSDDGLVPGSPAWRIVDELRPAPGEHHVHKRYGDAFEGTDLAEVLAAERVGALVVVGAETDACVRSTIHGAFTRGYDVTLVADAHTTADQSAWGAPAPEAVIAHTNLYWAGQGAPGRTAAVLAADEVAFDGRPAGR